MADMAEATHRKMEAANYRARFTRIQSAFNNAYTNPDGTLKVNTQTAYVLALWTGLLPEKACAQSCRRFGRQNHP